MSELDRKIKHLEMLRRTLATLQRRIDQQEKEINKAMLTCYAEINK